MMKVTVEKKNKGQSLVETALILPVIVLLLMGIIDFGLLLNNYLVISNASREGARKAAVTSDDVLIENGIKSYTDSLDQSELKITILPEGSLRKRGDEVCVSIEYKNHFLTPVISALVPNALTIQSKTVMRVE